MSEPSAELIEQARAGEGAAWAELLASQQRYVYSMAMSVMRNEADAADLTQEAFLRLVRSLHSYRAETRFTTWLYRLVINLGLDELRRRQRRGPAITLDNDVDPIDVAEPAELTDPLLQAIRVDDAQRVRAAVQKLPIGQRVALTLYYFDDLGYEEIAHAMQIPLNTVKSNIRRGKMRLAVTLAEPSSSSSPAAPGPNATRDYKEPPQALRLALRWGTR